MSEHAEKGHAHPPYLTIWVLLVVFFVASVTFSLFSSVVVGVVFAFFIAIIKALMVASYFMHLNIEPRFVWYMLGIALLAVFIMWLGIAPDVMELNGANWSKAPTLAPPMTFPAGSGH